MKPGIYTGKLKDAYLPTRKEGGNLQAALVFDVYDLDKLIGSITWFGSFSTVKAINYAYNALDAAGLKGDVSSIADGISAFEPRELVLVIEEHTYNEKTSLRVKYINEKGKVQSVTKMTKEQAKVELSEIDQQIRALRAEKHKADAPAFIDDGNMPF